MQLFSVKYDTLIVFEGIAKDTDDDWSHVFELLQKMAVSDKRCGYYRWNFDEMRKEYYLTTGVNGKVVAMRQSADEIEIIIQTRERAILFSVSPSQGIRYEEVKKYLNILQERYFSQNKENHREIIDSVFG